MFVTNSRNYLNLASKKKKKYITNLENKNNTGINGETNCFFNNFYQGKFLIQG